MRTETYPEGAAAAATGGELARSPHIKPLSKRRRRRIKGTELGIAKAVLTSESVANDVDPVVREKSKIPACGRE
jgi:hypothetical protein